MEPLEELAMDPDPELELQAAKSRNDLFSTITYAGPPNYPANANEASHRINVQLLKLNTLHAQGMSNDKHEPPGPNDFYPPREPNIYDMQTQVLIDATYEAVASTSDLRQLTLLLAGNPDPGAPKKSIAEFATQVARNSRVLRNVLPKVPKFLDSVKASILFEPTREWFVECVKENLLATFKSVVEGLEKIDAELARRGVLATVILTESFGGKTVVELLQCSITDVAGWLVMEVPDPADSKKPNLEPVPSPKLSRSAEKKAKGKKLEKTATAANDLDESFDPPNMVRIKGDGLSAIPHKKLEESSENPTTKPPPESRTPEKASKGKRMQKTATASKELEQFSARQGVAKVATDASPHASALHKKSQESISRRATKPPPVSRTPEKQVTGEGKEKAAAIADKDLDEYFHLPNMVRTSTSRYIPTAPDPQAKDQCKKKVTSAVADNDEQQPFQLPKSVGTGLGRYIPTGLERQAEGQGEGKEKAATATDNRSEYFHLPNMVRTSTSRYIPTANPEEDTPEKAARRKERRAAQAANEAARMAELNAAIKAGNDAAEARLKAYEASGQMPRRVGKTTAEVQNEDACKLTWMLPSKPATMQQKPA